MKFLYVLLAIALIVPFMGCDKITLDDPKVVKLEKQMATLQEELEKAKSAISKLEKANYRLQDEKAKVIKDYNKLVDVNRVLIKERDMYKEDVAALTTDKAVFRVDLAAGKLYNKPKAKEVALGVLEFARKHDFKVKLKVEGYSSHDGPAELNMWFSKERAEGVFHKIMSVAGDDATKFNHNHVIAHGEESDDERKVVITVEIL